MSLGYKFLRNGKRSAKAKSARRNFQSRGRLLAFVLVPVHKQRDFANQLQVKAVVVGDLLRAVQVFDISLEDAV